MITARQYYFLDEKGIAQASIRIADNPSGPNKITVFGVTKYLPIPLGDGCGQMVEQWWSPESSDKPIGWWS